MSNPNCTKVNTIEESFTPYIIFDDEYIDQYSNTFINIITPKFLFVSIETNLVDVFISNVDSPKISKNEKDRLLFAINKKYISKLDYILVDDFFLWL